MDHLINLGLHFTRCKGDWIMVFNIIFNHISAMMVAVNFIGVGNWITQRNHQPAISHWQTLSGFKLTTLVVIGTDCTDSCKSNYHTLCTIFMTMTAPCEKGRKNTQLHVILHVLHFKFGKHYSFTYVYVLLWIKKNTFLKFRYQMMNLELTQMNSWP